MSMLSTLFNMEVQSLQQALGAKDTTSPYMRIAIQQWFDMYYSAVERKDEDDCQRMPFVIVNKLVKAVFSEYEATSNNAFAAGVLRGLGAIKQQAVQQALVGGEVLIKPVPVVGGFEMRTVRRDCFVPLARDAYGRLTSVGMTERSETGGRHYTLLERRTATPDGLRIESHLYVSDSTRTLGAQVPLGTLPQYAALVPALQLNIQGLGLVQMKTPLLNCVDGTADGVSVYAPAAALIQRINRNEQQLNDEFDNGTSRIIASGDMLEDVQGGRRLENRLFTALDDDPQNVGITIFSPVLREQSYLARKNEYLRNIESLIGFKRGILSDVEAAERTAKEITSSEGDYALAIIDFQSMWEAAVREAVALCGELGTVYQSHNTKADPVKAVVIDWGNGVLYDADKTWAEYMQMVQAGMLRPELALAWRFNLPCDTDKELAVIRAKYLPAVEGLLGGE